MMHARLWAVGQGKCGWAGETHVDVQLAVGGFVEDAGVALHGPLVQPEGNFREGVQVQPRLPQHQ